MTLRLRKTEFTPFLAMYICTCTNIPKVRAASLMAMVHGTRKINYIYVAFGGGTSASGGFGVIIIHMYFKSIEIEM